MNTILGIILFIVLGIWFVFELVALIKAIKERRKSKKEEKSEEKINNNDKEVDS